MGKTGRILVIDDEGSIRKLLRTSLELAGYQVDEAADGREGMLKAVENKPDTILLDLGLPDMDGIKVLKKLREWTKVPVIVLTVRDSDSDKVAALDSGADDYLSKPFSMPELQARIRVAARHDARNPESPVFTTGPLEMDFPSRTVKVNGEGVKLTATEYDLLGVLARNAGKVVTHGTLLKEVWGHYSMEHTQYLRVYMGKLRKKLGSEKDELITTETGVGYRLLVF